MQGDLPGNGWVRLADMAGEEECWEVICRSAVKRALEVLLGVPVLQEEDLTVSDAGKLAGLRITDGVGKMPRVDEPLFARLWMDQLGRGGVRIDVPPKG